MIKGFTAPMNGEGSMDQQLFTLVCGAVLLVVLVASFARYKFRGVQDEPHSLANPNVKDAIREMKDYLDIDVKDDEGGFAQTFDLVPMQMLSHVKTFANACGPGKGAKKRRK